MNRWYPLSQLFLARLREFYREPEALFWVYGFPLLMAIGLGLAFMHREPEPTQIDLRGQPAETRIADLKERLEAANMIVAVHDDESSHRRLRSGKAALAVAPTADGYEFVYDKARPEAISARHEAEAAILRSQPDGAPKPAFTQTFMDEPGNRYIDFLLPGLMGLNLMGGGLWGVGFVLVDMRVRKLLKRLLATPMRRGDFLLSILGARLVLMIPDMALLAVFGYFVFGVPMRGDWFTLGLMILTGAAAFAGLGLFIACRTEKTETVSGLMNLVMLPMWLLSGTFFSSKRFPDVMQPFIQALPLTQLNDGLREVMLEGAGPGEVAWRLGILAAWGVVCFALALKWFRWQ